MSCIVCLLIAHTRKFHYFLLLLPHVRCSMFTRAACFVFHGSYFMSIPHVDLYLPCHAMMPHSPVLVPLCQSYAEWCRFCRLVNISTLVVVSLQSSHFISNIHQCLSILRFGFFFDSSPLVPPRASFHSVL